MKFKSLKPKQRKMIEVIINNDELLHIISEERNVKIDSIMDVITATLNTNKYNVVNKLMFNTYRKCYLEYKQTNK